MQTPFDPSNPAYDMWLREPLDDEERALMNPDAWDWDNPVEVVVAKHPLAQLPIELTFDEIEIIEQAAHAAGVSPHAFIKRAALAAARVHQPELGAYIIAMRLVST